MIRQWEEFTGGPHVNGGDRLHVTLDRHGVILMNEKAFEAVGSPGAAALFFDKRNSTIGIRPTHFERKGAFRVQNHSSKSRHRIIRASTFCRHHEIRVTRTVAFPRPTIEDDGTLALELHSAIEIGKVRS